MRAEFESLIKYWADEAGEKENLGLAHYDIALLEQTHKVKLPDSFKDYLSTLCPNLPCNDHNGLFDDGSILWWCLDKLKESATLHDHNPDIFFFSDWGLECNYFGVCCKAGADYGKIIFDSSDIYAENIYQFIEKEIGAGLKNPFGKTLKTIAAKIKLPE